MNQEALNPCFCFPLRTGSTMLACFDILYGLLYIYRIQYLERLMKEFPEFFSHKFPQPTTSETMHWMFIRGNYCLMITSGIMLLAATQYLGDHYKWAAILSNMWLVLRIFLMISMGIFSNALLESTQSYFDRLGVEIVICIVLQFYFFCVVYFYIRDSKLELSNRRAINPLIIPKTEHESYLSGRPTQFNNALSFHTLYPKYFLKSSKEEEDDEQGLQGLGVHMDESMLQYTAAKSRVQVTSELDELDASSVVTLKSSRSVPEFGSSLSPSDMSILPNVDNVSLGSLPASFMDMTRPSSNIKIGYSRIFTPSQNAEIDVADVDAPSNSTVKAESVPKLGRGKKGG